MTALRHPIFPTPLFHTHTHTHLIHRSARSSILHDQRSSSCTISEAHLGAWLMKHDNRRRCPAGAWLTKHDHRRRCPAGAWLTKHNHAALRPNPQAIGGAWLTKQVLPGPSCTNTLGPRPLHHQARKEGRDRARAKGLCRAPLSRTPLAPAQPQPSPRTRRRRERLTKKVLPGPSCTNTLGSRSTAALPAHSMMQRAGNCVFCVLELRTRGMSDLRSLTSYPR